MCEKATGKCIWIINHNAMPPSMGGLNRHYYFYKHLVARGYRVRIFTSSQIHNTQINMIQDNNNWREVECDGVPYTFVRTSNYTGNGFSRMVNMLDFPLRMGRIYRAFERPDIIYTSSPDLFACVAAVYIAKRLSIPCIMEVRDLWPESIVAYTGVSRTHPMIRALYQLERWLYRKSDRIIFTIPGGKDYLVDRGLDKSVSLDKVAYINNGVDLKAFDKNCRQNIVEDPDITNPNTFKVIYAGSMRSANGLDLLLDAAAIIQKRRKEVVFLLYGNGDYVSHLKEKAHTMGLDNIRFKGWVQKDTLPYILSQSSVNMLHYAQHDIQRYGGSQNKLFEYFACGKPILCDIALGYDLVQHYNAGISLKKQSPQSIVNAIEQIADLPADEYARYCKNARDAAQEFDYSVLTEKLIRVIKGLEEKRNTI